MLGCHMNLWYSGIFYLTKQDSQSKINCPVPASIQFLICDTGMKNITPLKMRKYRIVTAYCVRYGILLFVFYSSLLVYMTRYARQSAEVNRPHASFAGVAICFMTDTVGESSRRLLRFYTYLPLKLEFCYFIFS